MGNGTKDEISGEDDQEARDVNPEGTETEPLHDEGTGG